MFYDSSTTHRQGWRLALHLLVFLWAVFLGPPAAGAEEDTGAPADTVYVVPDIVIEAPRLEPDYKVTNRPGFVAVLDVSARRHRVEDLPAVLSQMVGVRTKQYGGLGSFATVSIRGSASNQVDLFLDGIPLGDAWLGVTNLADLPIDGLARIEVFRGFTPPHLGSSAMGGAVNLVTNEGGKWGRGESHAEVHASHGSFGTKRQALSLWSGAGPVRVFLHGGQVESRGNFTYTDDNGTPHNPDDDVERTRTNNDFASLNVLGRLLVTLPVVGDVSLTHNAFERDGGVAGLGSVTTHKARSARMRHLSYLQWVPPQLAGHRLRFEVDGFHTYTNEKFTDLDREVTLSPQATDNDFTTWGLNARSRFDVPRVPVSLELFAEGKREKYHPESSVPAKTSGPDGQRSSYRFAAATDVVLERLRLVLSATQRFEGYTSEFNDPPLRPWLPPNPQGTIHRDEQTPQVGFRWHPASFATVKGNYGRYFRIPTLLELYGNTGSVTGNGALVPEEGINRDIGVVLAARELGPLREPSLEVVYLDNKIDNLILFFPNSQYTSRAENISSARVNGIETAFSTFVTRRLRFAGNYTYLDTRNTSPIPYYNGNHLPSRPANDAALFIDVIERWWSLSYEYHHIGGNFLDRANLAEVPSRDIHNVALRISPFTDAASLAVEGKNLTGNQVRDVAGYPLPGRAVYATVGFTY